MVPDKFKTLQKNSSRHHYIPEFLSKAFTNNDGKIFVFDKEKNKILERPKVPKSIFFEWDRNTVEVKDGIHSSVIEDCIYSEIDSKASKAIKYFQNEEVRSIDFGMEKVGHLGFFLIALFWRIPHTDKISENVIDRAEIVQGNSSIDAEVFRKDPTFRKFHRTSLADHTIKEMVEQGKKGKYFVNVHSSSDDSFLLSDNPILFRTHTNRFSDLFYTDHLFAISSRRIFSSTESVMNRFLLGKFYNAAIIDQASRFVCSGNIRLLEESLDFYEMLKGNDFLQSGIERCFLGK